MELPGANEANPDPKIYPRPDLASLRSSENSIAIGVRQQLSRDQWNAHKGLIRSLYLDSDKTFSQVAAELEHLHNFAPTKRQFTRKLKEWGFKKNTTRDERIQIIRSVSKLDYRQHPKPSPSGNAIHKSKIERWRKDIRKDEVDDGAVSMLESSQSLGHYLQCVDWRSSINNTSSTAGYLEKLNNAPKLNDHSLLYTERWASVDLLGSPRMRRFFKLIKLEINSPTEEIEDLVLPGPADNSSCLSTNRFGERYTMDVLPKYDICTSNTKRPFLLTDEMSKNRLWIDKSIYPFRFAIDVWFPSGVELSPSPFNEIYPFPPVEEDPPYVYGNDDSTTEIISLQHQERQLKNTLENLQKQEQGPRVRILETMEDLARVYSRQAKYEKAETLYRQIITIQDNLGLHDSKTTMWAHVMLNRSLNLQYRNKQAFELHDRIHAKITSLFPPEDCLTLASFGLQADLLTALGYLDESEEISRQGLQISLLSFGPKHSTTMLAIRDLARSLGNQKFYRESEDLLSILVQLQQEDLSNSVEDICLVLRNLASTMYHQGRYAEALSLVTKVVDTAVSKLGERHPTTLFCYQLLASSLCKNNRPKEGRNILDHRLALQFNLMEFTIKDPNTMSATRSYGKLLLDRKEFQKAATILKRAYSMYAAAFGASHVNTMQCCSDLEACYEGQGLSEKTATGVEVSAYECDRDEY